MTTANPITVSSSEEQPAKRLKRSADDIAVSSLIENGDSAHSKVVPSQPSLPEHVYVLQTIDSTMGEDQLSIDGVYVTLEDATNAAWEQISQFSGEVEIGSISGRVCLSLQMEDPEEGRMVVEVHKMQLWSAGSVPRPHESAKKASASERDEDELKNEEEDDEHRDFDD